MTANGASRRGDAARDTDRGKRLRRALVVESDLPTLSGVPGWERELLLPIVEPLIAEALAGVPSEAQDAAEVSDGGETKQEEE